MLAATGLSNRLQDSTVAKAPKRADTRFAPVSQSASDIIRKQSEACMEKKFDVNAIVNDIFWGVLPVVGMLAAVGTIALVMRLSIGKW